MCTKEILDVITKIATILIAIVNLYFVVRFFRIKNFRDDIEKEKDRKLQLLKTLVLDNGLEHFYKFYEDVELLYSELLSKQLNDTEKQNLSSKVDDKFIQLRRKFLDSIIGVDQNLFQLILKKVDDLQDQLTNNLFDGGINLNHKPKYDEVILNKLTYSKTEVIRILYTYRG